MLEIGKLKLKEFPVILAPMEGISDASFRMICKKHGADLMYTEFISAQGLIRDGKKSIKKLEIFNEERPIGIQIFGNDIDAMQQAAVMSEEACPDLIDINYGCPVRKVAGKGSGAGLLLDVDKMQSITQKIVNSVSLPVTVKTRLGWSENHINILEVARRLQDVGIQALTIHGRTRSQMYSGKADWKKIAEVKHNADIHIPIFGNGDVNSPQKALECKQKYGVDGIMIGRAAIGYPWIFRDIKHYLKTKEVLPPPNIKERLETVKEHFNLSIQFKGERRTVLEMRKYYSNYFREIENFKPFKIKLLQAATVEDVFKVLKEIKVAYM